MYFDTNVDTCLDRNALRDDMKRVSDLTITSMSDKFALENITESKHVIVFKEGETTLTSILESASVPDEVEAPKELN